MTFNFQWKFALTKGRITRTLEYTFMKSEGSYKCKSIFRNNVDARNGLPHTDSRLR